MNTAPEPFTVPGTFLSSDITDAIIAHGADEVVELPMLRNSSAEPDRFATRFGDSWYGTTAWAMYAPLDVDRRVSFYGNPADSPREVMRRLARDWTGPDELTSEYAALVGEIE